MLGILRRAFSFTSWEQSHPSEPPPGDMLDASFDAQNNRISELEALISDVRRSDGQIQNAVVGYDSLQPDLRQALGLISAPRSGASNGDELGWKSAEATAEVWAAASKDWAEHMPDTIPDGSVAVMDITGDHWSSRWWAHQAAIAVGSKFAGIVISDTPPPSPQDGLLWWSNVTGNLHIWYIDQDSAQWVQINTSSSGGGLVTPEMFGALGDGVTDDSAAFTAALAASYRVTATPGKTYVIKDVVISASHTLDMNNSTIKGAAGAKWLLRMTGYEPNLVNVRFDDFDRAVVRSTTLGSGVAALATSFTVASATGLEVGMLATVKMTNNRWHISPITVIAGTTITVARAFETTASSGAAVDCSWGMLNIRGAYRFTLSEAMFSNASFGVVCDSDPAAGLSYQNLRGTVEGVELISCPHVGWFSGRDCADTRYERMSFRGGSTQTLNATGDGVTAAYNLATPAYLKGDVTVTVAGVAKTQPTHWTFITASQIQFTGGNIPTAGQAIVINNAIDGKAGLVIDATGWSVLRGGDSYSIIECLGWYRGYEIHAKELTSFDQIIGDTCAGEDLYLDACLHQVTFGDTFLGYGNCPIKVVGNTVGVFFNGPLYTNQPSAASTVAAPTYAVDVEAGSSITINVPNWHSTSDKARNLAGTYDFVGSTIFTISDILTTAIGATVWYTPSGQTTTERGNWTLPRAMRLVRLYVENSAAAAAGSYTYMVRNNGVDTVVTGSITGSGFVTDMPADLSLPALRRLSLRVVSAGGAPAAAFRGFMELI